MPTLTLVQAEDLVVTTLLGARSSEENARSVARALVGAEADGLTQHGLARLPVYTALARAGQVDGMAVPSLSRPRPAIVSVDAAHGFAVPALDVAVAVLPDVARDEGIAVASIRRAQQCEFAGHCVERLAELGLVALCFAGARSAEATASAGRGPLGNTLVAVACPLPGRAPLVVDLGRAPEEWETSLDGGRASNGAQEMALALMIELVVVGLLSRDGQLDAAAVHEAAGAGQLLLALDPVAVGGDKAVERFARLAASLAERTGLRLRDEQRLANRRSAAAVGLTVSTRILAEIGAA